MTDIGYIAIALALVTSLYSAVMSIVSARQGRVDLMKSAKNGVVASFGLMTIATGVLLWALISRDFSLEYVWQYTDRSLSLVYTLAGIWAGSTGSLLFWAWLLSMFIAIIALQKRNQGKELVPYAVSVALIPQIFFLALLITISNPFVKNSFTPPDGNGLNPLLENPGMFLHPPTLLAGYALFTIPFAFAIAALITRKVGDDWLVASRRWTLVAWMVLGIGNLAGMWWAYYVLGWGGMWAWDPVENAGLLPWLVGTALLHSAMMQRRRGILKRWNMVLVILTFLLSIFGTFLTRSGIIASVHTFSDSALGMLFLVFMGISAVGSFILLYMRNEDLKSETQIESIVSRESTFLLNNLFLVCGTAAVLLGTIFPILSEAVRGVKITVGPPFYNQVMAPLFLGIIFLTGVCTMIGWRRASKKNLLRNFLLPLVATAILAVVLFATVIKEWYAVLAFSLCGFVIFTIIYEWFRGTRARARMRSENFLKAFWGLFMANRPRYGGYIVHIGIVLLAVGVIGSSVYDESKEVTLQRGDTVTLDGYTLTLKGSDTIETASKVTFTTTLSVKEGDRSIGLVTPEKYIHRNHNTPVTVAAVRSTLLEDLYVILIGSESDGSASFKIMSSPLVIWVWIGGAIHVLGGLIAFWPGGRKQELLADVAEV